MNDLEYLVRNENGQPIVPGSLHTQISHVDFSSSFTAEDYAAVERRWARIEKPYKLFTGPGTLATLIDITGTQCTFRPTEFKHYAAVQQDVERKELSPHLYDAMRVASVGGILKLSDGYVVVQKRGKNLLCEPGKYDSSCAGFVMVKNGALDFEGAVLKKLKQELNIEKDDVIYLDHRAVRSSRSDCYSAMWDFLIETPLNRQAIEKRINRERVHECLYVQQEAIPEFISKFYGHGTELIGDGAGALLSMLSQKEFQDTTTYLRKYGRHIAFGRLSHGKFVESASPLSTAR